MAMTKAQIKERRAQKKAAWAEEINNLRTAQWRREQEEIAAIQNSAAILRQSKLQDERLEKIHRKILSDEFKIWYEVTTGEEVKEFLNEVVISPDQYSRRRVIGSPYGFTQIAWTEAKIEQIILKNPWSNPETKPYWADKVRNSDNPRERRRIMVKLATPRWAKFEKIIEIYKERERMTKATGVKHEVDHIVPIMGRDVCGLHCEFNLRVITEEENRKKSNNTNHLRNFVAFY